jgi:hypothetical protein
MIFTVSEMYCEAIRQDAMSEHSDIQYDCQSFESKRAHAVAMICRLRQCSHENGDTCTESEMCPIV